MPPTLAVMPPEQVDIEEFVIAANRSFPGRSESAPHLQWKWANNGFGEPLIVTVRSELGALQGALVFGASRLGLGTEVLNARTSYDTFVVPEARGQGAFGNLIRLAIDQRIDGDLWFNFPNRASMRGFQRAGWRQVGKVRQLSCPSRLSPLAVSSLEPSAVDVSDVPQGFTDSGTVRWHPNQQHLIWRIANPSRETHLLTCAGLRALVAVHNRRSIRELRVLYTWPSPSTHGVGPSLRAMARSLDCTFVTSTEESMRSPFTPQGSRGPAAPHWLWRPSHALLHVHEAEARGSLVTDWKVTGGMFHTW